MTSRRLHRAVPAQRRDRLLGVDASLNSTGYAFEDRQGVPVTDRITPGTKRGSARLHHNLMQLSRLLDNATPQVMVLEGYAMSAKSNSVFQIGEWGGLIRLEAWRRGIKVITVTPNTLKYAATGSGAAKKPQMIAAIMELFGLSITQDDEADAFLLYKFGEAFLYHTGPKAFVERVLEKANNTKSGIDSEMGMRR